MLLIKKSLEPLQMTNIAITWIKILKMPKLSIYKNIDGNLKF